MAEAAQVLLSSLSDQATFLGSPPDPIAKTCLSFVTITASLFTGAFDKTVATVVGELGCHLYIFPSLAEQNKRSSPQFAKLNDFVSKLKVDSPSPEPDLATPYASLP